MKKSETHSAQKECRELLIFLLVTYGIPYLMIIPMAILTDMGKKVDFFVSAQMFCPAAGLLLAKLLCDKAFWLKDGKLIQLRDMSEYTAYRDIRR